MNRAERRAQGQRGPRVLVERDGHCAACRGECPDCRGQLLLVDVDRAYCAACDLWVSGPSTVAS